MKNLKGKTAVITGAASGFGRELAILCAGEGMNVVLADVDEKGLEGTEALLKGAPALRVKCDVRKPESVENVADQAYKKFGAAHLLFNNAGVAVGGPTWSTTLDERKWVLDVNLMGVVNGIRAFVPRMLKQKGADAECHVVNTASVAGLISVPGSSIYCVSKHGVVTLSECLALDLGLTKAPIGVSVLCPAFVNTGIADAGRNMPPETQRNPMAKPFEDMAREATRKGKLSATDVARATMAAVKDNRFYILTHQNIVPSIETRFQDILQGRTPTNMVPKAHA